MNRLSFLKALGLIALVGPKLLTEKKPKYICVYDPVLFRGNESTSMPHEVYVYKLHLEEGKNPVIMKV